MIASEAAKRLSYIYILYYKDILCEDIFVLFINIIIKNDIRALFIINKQQQQTLARLLASLAKQTSSRPAADQQQTSNRHSQGF
jgi:hypothetical protein